MVDWRNVVSTYKASLWRTAYRVLNHHDDALECCQEALLDAYEYALTHEVEEWGAFLTSLTARRAIDRLRQRASARQILVPLGEVPEPATTGDCPVGRAEASELVDELRRALLDLPAKQAEVFWLSCIEQISHDQISRQLAISQNESRVLLHRARSRLKELLDARDLKVRSSP